MTLVNLNVIDTFIIEGYYYIAINTFPIFIFKDEGSINQMTLVECITYQYEGKMLEQSNLSRQKTTIKNGKYQYCNIKIKLGNNY